MSQDFEYDVFICHGAEDRPFARKLATRLRGEGLKVTRSKRECCKAQSLVLVISRALFSSDWETLEVQTLFYRDPAYPQRRFIPLLLEDCDVPSPIAEFPHVDWQADSDRYGQLLAAIHGALDQAAMILEGHEDAVYGVAITPDGRRVVSGSGDKTLKVWDLETGQCIATFKGHRKILGRVTVTPDGKCVVSGSEDKTLKVWDLATGQCIATFKGDGNTVWQGAVTPNEKLIVAAAEYEKLKAWDLGTGQCTATLEGHSNSVLCVAVTPDGRHVVSSSHDKTLKTWNLRTGKCVATFEGHTAAVWGLAVTPDGKRVISASNDRTLKVWELETGQCIATFEGHSDKVLGVAVTPDGKRVLSASKDKTLKVWGLEMGQCVATFEGHLSAVWDVAVTPDGKRVVSASEDRTLRVWDMPVAGKEIPAGPRYTNAKVVLVGESGVGKTGLAIRLAEDRWEMTDSTHGMNVWQLDLDKNTLTEVGLEREVWLWDFAGQPDYRLIHQLYMDETALAVMVIDPQRDDPFEPLGHWEKALAIAVKHDPARVLVAARCDRGGLTVSQAKVDAYCAAHGFRGFLGTSAKSGGGRAELLAAIAEHIPWDRLPWTATTQVFKTLKEAIVRVKESGTALIRMAELRERLQLELGGEFIDEEDLRTVVGLLSGQGLIQMLDFGGFVLLQPERINNYASAVVRCARDHSDEIGCVRERDVLDAAIPFPEDMPRLGGEDEKILLRAMLETFVSRSLCIREDTPEGAQLVFPSYFKVDRPEIIDRPHVLVTYGFSGVLDEVYATLVVRLHYTNDFEKAELWKDAADFKTLTGQRTGLQMTREKEGAAKIEVYFDEGVRLDAQVSFIKYIHEHLRRHAEEGSVTRVRSYVCPFCDEPLENLKAIKIRLKKGLKDILCGACEERVTLIDMIEDRFASDEFLRSVQEMDREADVNLDNESLELILVGHAYAIVAEAGQIYRQGTNSDWGIDGEVEFKNKKGQATGQRLYLQLKSGDSHLRHRKRDDKDFFQIDNPRWAKYWQSQAYPVMLVIRTSDGEIRWMDVSAYLKKHGADTKRIVFDGKPFTAESVLRMRDRLA